MTFPSRPVRSGIVLAVLAGAVPGQSIPAARAAGPGLWDVYQAPASGGLSAQVLADVELLPLDLAGFARREHLLSGISRPVAGAPAAHVRLAGGGSLYLARGGGQTLLLHVRPDGSVAMPFAAPDSGGPGLLAQLHVHSTSGHVLLATALGEAWLVDLAGAPPRALSPAGAAPADAGSLRVSAARAFFVAGGVLHAADLAAPGPAAPIVLGAPGDVALPELALSADGLNVAVVTEDALGTRLVHVLDEALQAHLITPAPGQYDTPNYASPYGPWLALSADGAQIAYRATIGAASEVFLKDVPAPAPAQQLTADGTFVDTIDNVGVLGFSADGKLHFMAGEAQAGGGLGAIGSGDLFLATPGAGGSLALSNVTNTSGFPIPPFLQPGEIELLDAALDPLGQRLLLLVDPNVGDAALLALPADLSAGETALLPALPVLPALHKAGDAVLVYTQECAPCASSLHLLPPAALPQLLASVPAGVQLDRFTDGAGRGSFVASAAPGLELAVRLDAASGAVDFPWPIVGSVGAALELPESSGDLVLSAGGAVGPQLALRLDGVLSGAALKVPVGTLVPLDF
jgi:hypothetical protein